MSEHVFHAKKAYHLPTIILLSLVLAGHVAWTVENGTIDPVWMAVFLIPLIFYIILSIMPPAKVIISDDGISARTRINRRNRIISWGEIEQTSWVVNNNRKIILLLLNYKDSTTIKEALWLDNSFDNSQLNTMYDLIEGKLKTEQDS
jgi:hypothetical protein